MRFNGRWHPAGTEDAWTHKRVEVGDIVAYNFRAWEVTHVRVEEFDEKEIHAARHYRPEAHDRLKPYHVSLRRLHGPKHDRENSRQDIALRIGAFAYGGFERYTEGRVPLCSCCGHPWPCLMVEARKEAERSAQTLDERMTKAAVGCCYGCGEPITQRQGSVTYPEDNVDLPGYPAPRFHTRGKCWGSRSSYEERRKAMYPDAAPIDADRAEGMF